METVLDTSIDPTYRGRIDYAVEMVKRNECDTIITQGSNFRCVKYKDPEKSKRMREHFLALLKTSEIRYIVVARKGNESLCIGTSEQRYVDNFSKATMYATKRDARSAMLFVPKPKGWSVNIETYLYRKSVSCRLRIYYRIAGLKTDYGVLAFIRRRVDSGDVISHTDRNGKPYVLLEDLSIFNGRLITLRNAEGVEYERVFDLSLLLHDGLIAFDAISDFAKNHLELEVPELRYLSRDSHVSGNRVFYDLGELIYSDDAVRDVAVKELRLQAWF